MSIKNDLPQDFTRRVSFNNLDPLDIDLYEDHHHNNNNNSYNNNHLSVNFNDVNWGYNSAVINDVSKFYDSGMSNYTFAPSRKRHLSASAKGNGGPKKSILKNKLSPQQLQYNIKNSKTLGINYHEELDDIINSKEFDKLDAQNNPNDSCNDSNDNNDNNQKFNDYSIDGVKKSRRKSYSEMTNEELMALDPQFSTTRSKIDQFKFDNHKTYYLPSKKADLTSAVNSSVNNKPDESNYKSINLTVMHENFNLSRTLLLVINGRKHTWRSLDYLINSDFLQDHDYLVIAALIDEKFTDYNGLQKKCQSILSYFLNNLPKNLAIKVTVEFVIDDSEANENKNGNKLMMNLLFNQYSPNFVLYSNKGTNLNFKYPIKLKESTASNFLVKYSSYMVKYSTVPVILINDNNAGPSPERIDKKDHKLNGDVDSSDESPGGGNRFNRKDSIASENSINSDASDKIMPPMTHENKYAYFSTWVKNISDKSLSESQCFLQGMDKSNNNTNSNSDNDSPQIKFDDSVNFNAKMQRIYASQNSRSNSNDRMYKVRSLIETDTNESNLEKIKSNNSSNSGLTTKSIKQNLRRSSAPAAVKPKKKTSFWKKIFK